MVDNINIILYLVNDYLLLPQSQSVDNNFFEPLKKKTVPEELREPVTYFFPGIWYRSCHWESSQPSLGPFPLNGRGKNKG